MSNSNIHSSQTTKDIYEGLTTANKTIFRKFVEKRGFTPTQASLLLSISVEDRRPITEEEGKDQALRGYIPGDVNQPLLNTIGCFIIRKRHLLSNTILSEAEVKFFLDFCEDQNIDLTAVKTHKGVLRPSKLYTLGDDVLKLMLFDNRY